MQNENLNMIVKGLKGLTKEAYDKVSDFSQNLFNPPQTNPNIQGNCFVKNFFESDYKYQLNTIKLFNYIHEQSCYIDVYDVYDEPAIQNAKRESQIYLSQILDCLRDLLKTQNIYFNYSFSPDLKIINNMSYKMASDKKYHQVQTENNLSKYRYYIIRLYNSLWLFTSIKDRQMFIEEVNMMLFWLNHIANLTKFDIKYTIQDNEIQIH